MVLSNQHHFKINWLGDNTTTAQKSVHNLIFCISERLCFGVCFVIKLFSLLSCSFKQNKRKSKG